MKQLTYEKQPKSIYRQLLWTGCASAALFLILCAVRGLYPLGDGSVLMIDLHSQYTPLLYRFYDVVCGQKNLFLDFSVSGGANLYADTVNEVINPFNYLLVLFGRERIWQAINVLLGVYVTAAALSVNFLLLQLWPAKRQWNLVFSLAYGFSGFAAYQFQIIKWMIFPVLFPLFVLAFVRLIREKKGGFYALLLAYQLMLNLQLGAMTLLTTLFASGLYFWFCVKKEQRREAMCRLAIWTLLGMALSAVVLWPGIVYLLTSARGSQNASYFAVMKQHGLDDLFERLFISVHPVLLGMFAAYAARGSIDRAAGRKNALNSWKQMPGEGRFLLILNVFLLLTVVAQPSNLLWHLGSYMCFPVRYGYILTLSAICLVKWQRLERDDQRETEEERKSLRAWQLGFELLSVLLCIGALFFTVKYAGQISQAFSTLAISLTCPAQTKTVALIFVVLTAAALLAFLSGKRRQLTMTAVVCISSLCLFLFILLPQDYAVRLMNEDAYREMNQRYQTWENAEGSFVRTADEEDLPLNAALVAGNQTLTGYFPAGSQQVYAQGLEQLGYLTPWVSTRSWGGTMISDGILGVKKEETPLTLGKALAINSSAEELAAKPQEAAAAGTLELQAYLGLAVTGREMLSYVEENEILEDENGGIAICVDGKKALYLDAGTPAANLQVQVNGKEMHIPESSSRESEHRLLYLGTYEDQQILLQVTAQDGSSLLKASDAEQKKEAASCLGLVDVENWKQAAGTIMTADVLTDNRKGSMQIDVSSLDRGQTLFVPVAAIDGWTCRSKNKNVEITPVLGGFMGISIPEDTEILHFTFCPPGLKSGAVISAAAVLLMLLMVWFEEKICEKGSRFFAVSYKAVWIAGIIVVYLIPNIGMVCYMVWKILKG